MTDRLPLSGNFMVATFEEPNTPVIQNRQLRRCDGCGEQCESLHADPYGDKRYSYCAECVEPIQAEYNDVCAWERVSTGMLV